jgi:p-aminobenzoyl-glutamate transporter AbgT
MERERETIVTTDGGRGGGSTVVIILGLVALLVILFLVFGQGLVGGADTTEIKADVDVSAPGGEGN